MKCAYVFAWLAATVGTLFLDGCANVNAIPVTNANSNSVQGLRLPERKPLIVVSGSTTSVLWVCNYDRSVALQFSSFLAKHHFKANFDACGSLSSVDSEMDNTAVPLALITFLQNLADKTLPSGGAVSASVNGSSGTGKMAFQIFDVRFGPTDDITLVPLVRYNDLLQISASAGTAAAGASFGSVNKGSAGGSDSDKTNGKGGDTTPPTNP